MSNVKNLFENYLKSEPIFTNKRVLEATYAPSDILHRGSEMEEVAKILSPSLRNEKPSNVFIYGKTGTGKTITVQHTAKQLQQVAATQNVPLQIIYVNCKLKKVADTEYRLLAQLTQELGKEIPVTGLPTQEVYKIFFQELDKKHTLTILILDEIDQLVKKIGDEFLYNLTRINSDLENSQISVVGISNDTQFTSNLDPRVKSSLSEEELLFPPYNAIQLQDILRQRSKEAFKEDVIHAGVIEKCAAYAAREHGDARRALELLRVAGELADRNSEEEISLSHLDLAEEKIERDKVYDLVETQPKQHQLTLYAIIEVAEKRQNYIFTGEVYEIYKKYCDHIGLRPLTQRRVSDIIGEFDMLGIIYTRVVSKGRYGRTREISVSIPESNRPKIKELLERELSL